MSDNSNDIAAKIDVILDGVDLGEAENELVALSASLPLWQKDALRRIAQKDELDTEDKEVLKTAMYAEHSLDTLNDKLVPLAAEHCKAQIAAGTRAIICSIGSVTNVNQLAEDQPPLQFTPDGITLIYGDNGSGKSGYSRIAKKICRARAEDNILGNAYSEKQGVPSANIRWRAGDDQKIAEFNWVPDQAVPDALSAISVFDTNSANLYVDGDNRIAFLPFEVDVFKKLVDLCSEFKTEIEEEIANTENGYIALPELTPETSAAKLIDEITEATTEETLPTEDRVREFAVWSEDDGNRLKELQLATTQNSIAQADLRSRCTGAITKLAVSIEHLENAFSDEQVISLRQKFDALQAAKIANDLAAKGSFTDMPLGHVGSVIWQKFFKYAKEYSTEVYPDHEFPYTGENSICVLCHQPLDDEAKHRFNRFENFISGKAAQEFQDRSLDLTTAVTTLNEIQIQSADDAKKMLVEFEVSDEYRKNIVVALSNFLNALSTRKDALIEAATLGTFDKITAASTYSNVLHAEAVKLKAEEDTFRKNAQNDEAQKKQAQELAELEGRKCLSENVANLIRNRTTHEKLLRLNKCNASVGTMGLSRKVSTLRERHLTNELNSKIKTEIEQFSLSYLNVKIKDVNWHAKLTHLGG